MSNPVSMSVLSSSLSRRKFSFLGDRYINLKEIGFGGMGRVYEAYDQFLKIKVAIKVLSSNNASVREIVRFQKEAQVASRLSHQNIVKVFDFGMDNDNDLFLIMDFVDGMSLQQIVDRKGPLPLSDVVEIICQVSEALEHAHLKGVIHRDIKPSNIMMSHGANGDFQIKLVDFGIAKIMAEDNGFVSGGNSVLTPLYSSPEQISNSKLDTRADIYSLGCVMYFLLTGEPPFRGQSLLDTLDMHLNSERPGLSGKECLPPEVEQVIEKALSINPRDRYQNIPEFQEDLDYLASIKSHVDDRDADKQPGFELNGSFFLFVIGNWRASMIVMAFVLIALFWITKCLTDVDGSTSVSHHMFLTEYKSSKFYKKKVSGLNTWHGAGIVLDDDLKFLANKNLEALHLQGVSIEGTGLKYIAGKNIVRLAILDSDLDDENYRYVGTLKNLTDLDFSYSNINDKGLVSIGALPELKSLHLKGCHQLTSQSLKSIVKDYPNLQCLILNFAHIDRDTFQFLSQAPKLHIFYLAETDITDDDIEELAKNLKNITALDISGNNRLTDRTMVYLEELKQLKNLSLKQCSKISDSAIEKFKTVNTKCSIVMPEVTTEMKDGEDVEEMIADFMNL